MPDSYRYKHRAPDGAFGQDRRIQRQAVQTDVLWSHPFVGNIWELASSSTMTRNSPGSAWLTCARNRLIVSEPGKMSGRPRTGADSAAPVQPDPTESNQMRRPVTRKIGIAGNAAPAGDGVAAIDIMRRLRSKRRTRMESPSESGSANLSPLHERRDFELPWLRGRGFQ